MFFAGGFHDGRTGLEMFDGERAADALQPVAGLAWLQQDARLMIDARLAAYQRYRACGEAVAAARMAVALGNDFLDFRGDAAVANGWFKRARRLLEALPPSAEHARLSVWEARLALIGRNGKPLRLPEGLF